MSLIIINILLQVQFTQMNVTVQKYLLILGYRRLNVELTLSKLILILVTLKKLTLIMF